MGRGKSSMTAEQRILAAVEESIAELKETVDAAIEKAKEGLREMYGGISDSKDAELEQLLADYEPSVTEGILVERFGYEYGNYNDAMEPLREAIGDEDENSFYISWSGLQNMTEERKRLLAGQMALKLEEEPKKAKSTRSRPYYSASQRESFAKGRLPGTLPGTRYEGELRKALDEISDNYKRSKSLEKYAKGSFANGTPHLRVSDQGDSAYVQLGNMSARVRFPTSYELTAKQKAALIEVNIYQMFKNGKDRL